LINICNEINLTNSSASLDNCLENVSTVIDDVCSPLFKKTINTQVRGKHREHNNNRWFNDECQRAKSEFYNNLNI